MENRKALPSLETLTHGISNDRRNKNSPFSSIDFEKYANNTSSNSIFVP